MAKAVTFLHPTSIPGARLAVLHDSREGQPGGNLPMNNRAGTETWLAGSYDPELNLT
jgi:hypothetical protein